MDEQQRRERRLIWGSALTGVAGLVLALAGAGGASADPVSFTQEYTCKFPIINDDAIEVTISADMPATMKVGETVPAYDITAVTKVSERAATGLGVMGAVTLEGKATADVNVTLPGDDGDLPIKVRNTVAQADIPDPAAAFDVIATGQSPGDLLTWEKAGTAKFDVMGIKLHNMIARDEAGNPVDLPPFKGEFEADCALGAGQPTTLHTMNIEGDGGTDPADPPTDPSDPPTDPSDPPADPTGPWADPADPTDPVTGGGTTAGGTTGGGSGGAGGAGTSGGTSGMQLGTAVTGSDPSGALAATGVAKLGLALAAAGGLCAAGIATVSYAGRPIRGRGQSQRV
jgi:hypothetical protein